MRVQAFWYSLFLRKNSHAHCWAVKFDAAFLGMVGIDDTCNSALYQSNSGATRIPMSQLCHSCSQKWTLFGINAACKNFVFTTEGSTQQYLAKVRAGVRNEKVGCSIHLSGTKIKAPYCHG